MSAVYKNPWHKAHSDTYGPAIFRTEVRPVQLGKYTRYQRIPGSYDFVFNGVCFAQRAGPATEAQIDADKYAQGNLLQFCGVKFGPSWDLAVGDPVTMFNEYGAKFPGKKIVAIDETAKGEPRFFIAPTDTPWFSFPASQLEVLK